MTSGSASGRWAEEASDACGWLRVAEGHSWWSSLYLFRRMQLLFLGDVISNRGRRVDLRLNLVPRLYREV